MNRSEIKNEIIVRGSIDTTSAFITEAMLNDWINQAHRWSASYHKWPFTEYMDKSQTYSSATEEYNYPSNFKADSIRILKIGDDIFDKKNFYAYLKFKEDYPDATRKFFSDFGRNYYVNTKSGASGTIYTYGQYTPGNITNETSSTVFSGWEPEGDEAIVYRGLSLIMTKQRKFKDALVYEDRAKGILDEIWERVKDEQYGYQTHDKSMYKSFNVLKGDYFDDLNNPLRW